jgi:hypothetical protein
MIVTESWRPPTGQDHSVIQKVAYYALLFAFYFANYFVITFFNTAIISCAIERMGGGNPTLASGFREAFSRLPLIAGWALVSATVGLVLRMIEERSEWVGRLVSGLLGMAFTVVSFLVVPVLVVERKGPFDALKKSTAMLRQTWGEQIVGNAGFGLVFFVLSLPAFALVVLGIYLTAGAHLGPAPVIATIAIAVLYLITLALIQSALQSIFQAAVYLYASGNEGRHQLQSHGFPVELVGNAMTSKR